VSQGVSPQASGELKARVEPEDVAALVLFRAADDARMHAAHESFVDAGWR
jgi:hypothetical protein